VIPIDIGHHYPFDIWLSYHADAAKLPRVRRMIDWTIEAFNPQANPWFADDFVHPKEFLEAKHLGTRPISGPFGQVKAKAKAR
jgi:hypothetical protein